MEYQGEWSWLSINQPNYPPPPLSSAANYRQKLTSKIIFTIFCLGKGAEHMHDDYGRIVVISILGWNGSSWLMALTFIIKTTQLKNFLMINEALMRGFVPKTPRQKPKQKYLIHWTFGPVAVLFLTQVAPVFVINIDSEMTW